MTDHRLPGFGDFDAGEHFCHECHEPWPAGWDIFGAVKTLCDEVDRLRLIEEWAQGADHCPGCSGGYGDQYRCKCGRRDLFG